MTEELKKAENKPVKKPETRHPSMSIEMDDKGFMQVGMTQYEEHLEVISKHDGLHTGVIRQIALIGAQDKQYEEYVSNFALGFLETMEPRDPAEALLVTQMAATHQAAMMMARKLNHVETIQQQDSAERALNKLMRTYTTQMETLKRYRMKGQQLVRVERVTVEEGGQAIVGNVQHGGGGDEKT